MAFKVVFSYPGKGTEVLMERFATYEEADEFAQKTKDEREKNEPGSMEGVKAEIKEVKLKK